MSPALRAIGLIGWGAAGLLLGTVGAFVQAARIQVLGFPWPWGTILVLGLLVVLVRSSIEVWRSRWAGWAVFVGWLVTTIGFATETPGGDLVISSGGRQLAFLFGGVILGSAAATVPALLGGRRATDPH